MLFHLIARLFTVLARWFAPRADGPRQTPQSSPPSGQLDYDDYIRNNVHDRQS
jgi:hypothetical protein